MIFIREINEKNIDLCFELDSNTIALWSKKQWANEFKKEGIKVFGLLLADLVIGICVFQVVLDEAQINYFDVISNCEINFFVRFVITMKNNFFIWYPTLYCS